MLKRIAAWWVQQPEPATQKPAGADNIIQLRTHVPAHTGAGEDDGQAAEGGLPALPLAGASSTATGLLDDNEIRAFFAQNHFGLGRHNGATYRTREALERGRTSLVANFRNALERCAARREGQLRRLNDTLIEVEGVSDTTSRRLKQATGCLENDKATLDSQISAATRGQGWVMQAILDYETGFAKGLSEAIGMHIQGRAEQ